MKKDRRTPEQILHDLVRELENSFKQWRVHFEFGCQDPFWPDGCNINLNRNHIIYFKGEIKKHCEMYNLAFPDVYYRPTPAELDNHYMASLDQTDRVNRLRTDNEYLTTKKPDIDMSQTTLF